MKQPTWMTVAVVALLGLWSGVAAKAVTIDLVPVGNPGNAPDTRYASPGYGGVPYSYQIDKFEVTAGQYAEFLNKVAATDTYGLYNPYMDRTVYPDNYGCNIQRSGAPGNYTYSVATDWANRPVNLVSWGDAARFANWLQNGQPSGGQAIATTEDGSYFLDGATTDAALMAVTRKPGATWVIPTENEWYKAAYYDPNKPGGAGYWDYPTKSNAPPINTLLTPDPGNHANFYDVYGTGNGGYTLGSPYYRTPVGAFANSASAYRTFDQGGNLVEWNDTPIVGSSRGLRGGNWISRSSYLLASARGSYYPASETIISGFRVAGVPEPGSITLLVCGAIVALIWRWRRK